MRMIIHGGLEDRGSYLGRNESNLQLLTVACGGQQAMKWDLSPKVASN